MLRVMMLIPPIHATAMSSAVLFWGMIGLLVALFLLATILRVVGNRRLARQSQVKQAGWQYEAPPQPQYDEHLQVHTPEEEKVLIRR